MIKIHISGNIKKKLKLLTLMKKLYFLFSLVLTLALVVFKGAESFSQQDSLVFTTSGEFTVPMGVSEIVIEVVGAGGN